MSVVPIPRRSAAPQTETAADWIGVAAAGTLIAAGALLLARKRRAGAATAAVGTALAFIEHRDTVRRWWAQLPGLADQLQVMLRQMQDRVRDLAARGDEIIQSAASLGQPPETPHSEG